jgi:hypothetical protein
MEVILFLSIPNNLFNVFSQLPPTIFGSPSVFVEKMLLDVFSGKKCIGAYTIICNGSNPKRFYIDPNFFSVSSNYFKTLFDFNNGEIHRTKEINLPLISKKSMKSIITYIYTQKICLDDGDETIERIEWLKTLFMEAEMMFLKDLFDACERELVEILMNDSDAKIALNLLFFSHTHSLPILGSIASSIVAFEMDVLMTSQDPLTKEMYKKLHEIKYDYYALHIDKNLSFFERSFALLARCKRVDHIKNGEIVLGDFWGH